MLITLPIPLIPIQRRVSWHQNINHTSENNDHSRWPIVSLKDWKQYPYGGYSLAAYLIILENAAELFLVCLSQG